MTSTLIEVIEDTDTIEGISQECELPDHNEARYAHVHDGPGYYLVECYHLHEGDLPMFVVCKPFGDWMSSQPPDEVGVCLSCKAPMRFSDYARIIGRIGS